ncbi:MFS transporter [Plantactinospora sonchi]|uniref:MFS transporter n=1 Tax=Plantactinospora sonchi TaxID=1544735 RepID=A0ABU7S048_9ACTN
MGARRALRQRTGDRPGHHRPQRGPTSLATALPASTSDLQWVANSYNLVFAAMLLPAGLLGDRLGRKRLLLVALALFGVASLACAYASSAEWLIGARALLGLGAAFVVPLCMSVLPVLFTPQERGQAIGLWVTANAVGLPLGPIVGGWLLDHYWWGSVFLINIPVIAIALIAVLLLMPESRSSQRLRLDLVGILVSCAGLACLTWGVIELGDRGVGNGTRSPPWASASPCSAPSSSGNAGSAGAPTSVP